MERPNRPKNQDKWRRIIQPAGDSDSSDWSSDSDFGLLLNHRAMAGHSSSSSTSDRPPTPGADVQNNEANSSRQQLQFFKLRMQNNVSEDKDVKPLGNADVGSSTSSNPLLHHNYAERNDNEEFDAQTDHFWLFARNKLSFLSDRPYYLGGSSDRDCGLPALPASSSSATATNSSNTEGNGASTSNMSDCWAEYAVNLKQPPYRKRLFVGHAGDDANGNQSSVTGSTNVQDNMPSTSSDVQLQYSPLKDLRSEWLVPKKSSGHGYKHSCFPHQTTSSDSVSQSVEDSSEIQIVSVLGGASNSTATRSVSSYSNAPPPYKKVRWSLPEIVQSTSQQFYERTTAADLTTRTNDDSNVEVINLEESVAETSSGSLKTEKETVQEEKTTSDTKTDISESCEEEQAGSSFASNTVKRDEDNEKLNQGIIGLLECPVCMEYMGPPINQCRRGHLICSHCKPKLATCPTCRSRFSEQRNLAMEKVAEKLHYPCKNVHMGCTHTLRLGDREEHESNCEHRNYRCAILPPCDWRGQHQEILPHIRITHSESLLFGAEHELKMILGNFSEQASQNWVVSALGELFRVNLGAVRGGRVQVFGCVIFLGPAYRASQFSYSLSVGPNAEDSAKRCLTFSRATHCYVDRCSLYYSSGDCFHLRTESAQLFCVGPCNILKVKLKIERVDKHH